MERTLAIVKPDAVRRGFTGDILKRIESAELRIVALRKIQLSRLDAEHFYEVHKSKPFFTGLCDYMTSGPVVIAVLQGEGAITKWRNLMGATDPKKPPPAPSAKISASTSSKTPPTAPTPQKPPPMKSPSSSPPANS